MSKVLTGLEGVVYLIDVFIYGNTEEQHDQHLQATRLVMRV